MLRRNKLILLKRTSDGRPKYETAKFLKLDKCNLSGVTMEDDKIIFQIYYKNKRIYIIGIKHMDVFTNIYRALDRRKKNTKNLLSEDNLDNEPH